MSHVVTIKTQVKSRAAVEGACRRLQLEAPRFDAEVSFSGMTLKGTVVRLSGWTYPVVFDQEGEAAFDNYEGGWGDPKRLDEFVQAYAAEAAIQAIQDRGGYVVSETTEADGSIRLQLALN